MEKRMFLVGAMLHFVLLTVSAQQVLSLDSCRRLALDNNKQLRVARLKQEVAANTHKAVATKFLPKVEALGGYEFTSREISILSGQQKTTLSNIGNIVVGQMKNNMTPIMTEFAQGAALSSQQAAALGNVAPQIGASLAHSLNEVGQHVRNAFNTDTRHVFMGAVMVRQPIFMGGGLIAANRLAALGEQMAAENLEGQQQTMIYDVDRAYWAVVSLRQKQRLARQYLTLVEQLDSNVYKMIANGVATRADGLQVDVKVNEAEMTLTQVNNGESLARMCLCQLCGLPIDSEVKLSDEDEIPTALSYVDDAFNLETAWENRPELKMLRTMVGMSEQKTRMERAAFLPQVALTAGYLTTNPNVYDGYERRFAGAWNVGVVMRIPVWNWMEGSYKVRASRATTAMAEIELSDIKEKVELQLNQSSYKLTEAVKRMKVAEKNVQRAEENLRCANVGFQEGVMQSTDVMAAQTAWLNARTQQIDAIIDKKLAQTDLQKAMGTLQLQQGY